jgi:hypothetical protein
MAEAVRPGLLVRVSDPGGMDQRAEAQPPPGSTFVVSTAARRPSPPAAALPVTLGVGARSAAYRLADPEDEGHAVDEDHRGEAVIHLITGSRLHIRLSAPAEER